MAQVNVIGRITADLELKTSEKSNPYVRFDIAENIGSRQTLHTQYFQVCAWGEDANRLMKAHAKKGSLILPLGVIQDLRTVCHNDRFGACPQKNCRIAAACQYAAEMGAGNGPADRRF